MLQQPVHINTIEFHVVNVLSIIGLLTEFRDLPQVLLLDGENVYQINIGHLFSHYFEFIIRLTSCLRIY